MSNANIQENKMGVMPVNKLLLNISLPMMLSMLVQALYNIVDSIFVAMLSEDALTAVSMAFPIQTLIIAFGAGTGVGINSLLSRYLGEKKQERVNKVAMNGILLAVVNFIIFLIVGIFTAKPFYLSQIGTVESDVYKYGVQYLTIICTCSFGLYAQIIFERLLQSTGKTVYSMIIQIVGAVTNIILDPIFIFGLGPIPSMGVAGAAIATVIGQCLGGCIGLYFNIKYNHEIQLSLKNLKPEAAIIGNIYKVGVPSIVMQSIGAVMTYGMNRILVNLSLTAVAVFGVYFKLQSFFFMPVFGMNNGMIPILAYNYGAGKRSRMVHTIKLAMKYAFVLLLLGFVVFESIPGALLGLFNASDEMLEIGIPALRIIGIHFLVAWFSIISSAVFQAVGNGIYSMIVSLARQLVVLLPAAYLLSRSGDVNLIWWSFPIAEIASLIAASFFLYNIWKKVISNIPDNV